MTGVVLHFIDVRIDLDFFFSELEHSTAVDFTESFTEAEIVRKPGLCNAQRESVFLAQDLLDLANFRKSGSLQHLLQ